MPGDILGMPLPASTGFNEWITTSEPGRIASVHPCLAPFAPWLWQLWEKGKLEPTGPVPDYRQGIDELTGIAVEYGPAPLPIIASPSPTPSPPSSPPPPPPLTPYDDEGQTAPVVSSDPISPIQYVAPQAEAPSRSPTRPTLLLECIGVVQLHFFVPPALRYLLSRILLISGLFLVVQIPTVSWAEGQLKKLDVFEALCREISNACHGVETRYDWLILRDINPLRTRLFRNLAHTMESVTHRVADIPYAHYTQNNHHHHHRHPFRAGRGGRRLFCYEAHEYEHSPGSSLILRQQNVGDGGGGYMLGLAIWAPGEMSLFPSHTTLFHFLGGSYSGGSATTGATAMAVPAGVRMAPWFVKKSEAAMLREDVASARASLLEHYAW